MNIMIVGGNTRLLDYIENQICQCNNEARIFKTTALNNAIMQTQSTACDLVISTLQISYEDGLHLSDVFRSENYNAHTPVVSICEQEEDSTWTDTVLYRTIKPNFFASDVEELLQIVGEVLTPAEVAQIA